MHCVKSIRIRSYSGPHFPTFGLNTDQNNYEYGHFLRSNEHSAIINPKSLRLALPWCSLQMEKATSAAISSLLASNVLNIWITLDQPFSHFHWHLPYQKYLAVSYINTRNGYKNSKYRILCFLGELALEEYYWLVQYFLYYDI